MRFLRAIFYNMSSIDAHEYTIHMTHFHLSICSNGIFPISTLFYTIDTFMCRFGTFLKSNFFLVK